MSDVPLTLLHLAALQAMIREVSGYHSTIAGGAVRDLIYGVPVKDIDVFIERERDTYDPDEVREDMTLLGLSIARQMGASEGFEVTSASGYSSGEQVYATGEFNLPGLPTINLILVEDLNEALNEFPDTLSQVYLDDEGQPVTSNAFEGVRLGTDPVHTRLDAGNKRVKRLEAKYPDMSWVHNAAVFETEFATWV